MSNFKVRCVYSYTDCFTKNKEYVVTNGTIKDDHGNSYKQNNGNGYESVEQINSQQLSHFVLVSEPQQFTKDMLKTGMRVERRNGDMCVVLKGLGDDKSKFVLAYFRGDYSNSIDFNDDLTSHWDKKYDIVKVFKCPDNDVLLKENVKLELLWQRPELKKMTHLEIEKALGFNFEYVEE